MSPPPPAHAAALRRPLGEILKEHKLISDAQLQEALSHQRKHGGALGKILVELGHVAEQDILLALGSQAGMEVVDLDQIEIPREIIDKVSVTMANTYRIVPIRYEDNILTVAMADPLNVAALDDLRFTVGCEVRGAVSNEEAILRAIEKIYAGATESVEDLIAEIEDGSGLLTVANQAAESIDEESLQAMANSAPVIKLVNLVLLTAIRQKASDVHFEPFETEYKIRYRVDGVLYEMLPPPLHLSVAIASRIKVMAKMNIAERRMPQDSSISLTVAGHPVDLRVSTLPTMFGESVVMRVLDRSIVSLDLEQVGMREDELAVFRTIIRKPHGIVLVTGPTGSGKTTTLYSALNELNNPEDKIITTEDPVEYPIDGLIQIPINEEIGVTFAECLRRILRHDPDIILVGEIRDLDTAQTAVQSSLTGHLVFSTLHTNDAPSTITRLIEIGVEPFLIAATLESIIAQRLIRKICLQCRLEYQPSDGELMELNLRRE
ncbi:MAG: ATPase, T2SS/T4P/T4SS family, partial [Planctomycetota bacterium]